VQRSRSAEERRLKALGVENVRVTPLGLLSAYRRLALMRRQASSDSAMNPIFAGLEASVGVGMARAASVEGMSVAGKTGTAGAAEGNWTHAWFAGYAPAEKPEVAVVVFLERGTGAHAAAPVGQKILAAFHDSRGRP
jgi:penicillin-binding protein 2